MYAFTNHFSKSSLRERIGMMNRRRSGYAVLGQYISLLLITFSVAFACQFVRSSPSHRYIEQRGNDFFGLITSQTSDRDLDTLRRELSQRNVAFDISELDRLPDGRIQRITVTLKVPKPGHLINVAVGSPLGQSSILAVGLHCDEKGCRLGSINNQFPDRLQQVAARESALFLVESHPETTHLINDANSVFGLYRVYFRNDFLESTYFGLRSTGVRMTPDFHLDVYPQYRNAVVFIDGREVNRDELRQFHAIDLKKVVVFDGKAAVMRLGDERAKNGLILISRLKNIAIRDKYASTRLLDRVYPQLFVLPQ